MCWITDSSGTPASGGKRMRSPDLGTDLKINTLFCTDPFKTSILFNLWCGLLSCSSFTCSIMFFTDLLCAIFVLLPISPWYFIVVVFVVCVCVCSWSHRRMSIVGLESWMGCVVGSQPSLWRSLMRGARTTHLPGTMPWMKRSLTSSGARKFYCFGGLHHCICYTFVVSLIALIYVVTAYVYGC